MTTLLAFVASACLFSAIKSISFKEFSVLSVDHSSALSDGKYFNFDISEIDRILGRIDWDSELFVMHNERTQVSFQVKLWRESNGGSIGDGHGRREPYDDATRKDWRVSDVLTFIEIDETDAPPKSTEEYSHDKALVAMYYSYTSKCDADNLRAWDCKWCQFTDELSAFQMLSVTETETLQAFIGYDPVNSRLIATYRSTDNKDNWFNVNFDTLPTSYLFAPEVIDPKVFSGFIKAYQELEAGGFREAVQEAFIQFPGSDIFLTGHSLGAALSCILALELRQNPAYNVLEIGNIDLITFGSPRVFNKNLALHFNKIVHSNWRVVNRYDLVPTVPTKFMGYYHVSTQIWYENQESDQYYQCDGTGEDSFCHGTKFKLNEFPDWRFHLLYFNIDLQGDACSGPALPRLLPSNSFKILSVDHKTKNSDGQYFNFDIATMDNLLGRTDWDNEVFYLYNDRRTAVYEVIIWRDDNGGSIGGGHGRRNPKTNSAKEDWETGDNVALLLDMRVSVSVSASDNSEDSCVWTLDDGSKLDLSALNVKYAAQAANGFMLNALTPCRNGIIEGMNCENTRSMVSWNPNGENCLRPLAVWEDKVVQPTYDAELKQWKFVYNNGEICDGKSSTLELFYVCDTELGESSMGILDFRQKDGEACAYQMHVHTAHACV